MLRFTALGLLAVSLINTGCAGPTKTVMFGPIASGSAATLQYMSLTDVNKELAVASKLATLGGSEIGEVAELIEVPAGNYALTYRLRIARGDLRALIAFGALGAIVTNASVKEPAKKFHFQTRLEASRTYRVVFADNKVQPLTLCLESRASVPDEVTAYRTALVWKDVRTEGCSD